MIISHSHKFIFIHNYKVAGSSVRAALSKFAYLKSTKNLVLSTLGIRPKIFCSDFPDHVKSVDIKKRMPQLFLSYFTFGFVRNPWDWQVSLYHFAKQTPHHFQHKFISKMNFEEYIDWRINQDLKFQKDFFSNGQGEIIVNYIGKFENLQNDFNQISNKIGIPHFSLPKKNSSVRSSYKEYYTSTTKEYIASAFEPDIKLFGYSFDS